jgi:hypothetical protein
VLLGELLDGAGNRISGKVCTAPARSVTWPGLGPCDAVSRLTRATRRSPRSLTQHVSGLTDADLTKSN